MYQTINKQHGGTEETYNAPIKGPSYNRGPDHRKSGRLALLTCCSSSRQWTSPATATTAGGAASVRGPTSHPLTGHLGDLCGVVPAGYLLLLRFDANEFLVDVAEDFEFTFESSGLSAARAFSFDFTGFCRGDAGGWVRCAGAIMGFRCQP